MIPNVECVSSIYIYKTNRKAWRSNPANELYCLAYQVSGNYDHKFKYKHMVAKSDTLLFFAKKDPYKVTCAEQGEALCITFAAHTDLPSTFIDCKAHPEIKVLFQKLMNYKNLMSVSNHCEAKAIIYRLLSFIYKQASPEYVEQSNRCKMQLAYDYITDHFADVSLKTGDLAERYDISPKYFRSLFKKIYNTTPTQCLISIRLQSAVKLLTETTLTISDIAEMSGFGDVYYFSKLFKSKFGCSPKEYRNKSSSFTILS